jgi:hypothetical protein
MPFKGTYNPLWEYGARKARLALKHAVGGVLNLLFYWHQILCKCWRKLCTLRGHLRLANRVAYCHDYLPFFEEGGLLWILELAPNARRLPGRYGMHDRRGSRDEPRSEDQIQCCFSITLSTQN